MVVLKKKANVGVTAVLIILTAFAKVVYVLIEFGARISLISLTQAHKDLPI